MTTPLLLGNVDYAALEAESLLTIGRALELGVNFLDTAWSYQTFGRGGNYYNEELLGKALKLYGREKFVVATKFGVSHGPAGIIVSGKEETIRSNLADSLSRLGTDYIDLYYQQRIDPATPIEETMLVLKSLVQAGTIRYIGLSECTPDELRRAHAVHPITAVQMEWSLQTRDIETTIVPVARELGVAIVAYSPLGRGFLTSLNALEQMAEGDFRRTMPRFSGENAAENARRTQRFFALAQEKGCTGAQLALAWVHAQGLDVFPIPGTKTAARIEENARAFEVLKSLSTAEIAEIADSVQGVVGDRYSAQVMATTYSSRK